MAATVSRTRDLRVDLTPRRRYRWRMTDWMGWALGTLAVAALMWAVVRV